MFNDQTIESFKYFYAPSIVSSSSSGDATIYDARRHTVWELKAFPRGEAQISAWFLKRPSECYTDPLEDDGYSSHVDYPGFNLAAAVYREIHPVPQAQELHRVGKVEGKELARILAGKMTGIHFRESMKPLVMAYPDGLLEVDQAGGVAPYQAEGTLSGYPFYFRYRNGNATLSVGGADPVSEPYWKSTVAYGNPLDGSLTLKEFFYLFTLLASRLDIAKTRYKFKPVDNFGYPESVPRQKAATWFLRDMREELGFPTLDSGRLDFLVQDILSGVEEREQILSYYAENAAEAQTWLEDKLPLTHARLFLVPQAARDIPTEPIVVHPTVMFPDPRVQP